MKNIHSPTTVKDTLVENHPKITIIIPNLSEDTGLILGHLPTYKHRTPPIFSLVLSPISPLFSNLTRGLLISHLNSCSDILPGFVLSAIHCHSKPILHNERMINLLKESNQRILCLNPLQFFSRDNSIKAHATCLLELIHTRLLRLFAFLAGLSAPASSTALSLSTGSFHQDQTLPAIILKTTKSLRTHNPFG